jgi:uncharacterized membrane protein
MQNVIEMVGSMLGAAAVVAGALYWVMIGDALVERFADFVRAESIALFAQMKHTSREVALDTVALVAMLDAQFQAHLFEEAVE